MLVDVDLIGPEDPDTLCALIDTHLRRLPVTDSRVQWEYWAELHHWPYHGDGARKPPRIVLCGSLGSNLRGEFGSLTFGRLRDGWRVVVQDIACGSHVLPGVVALLVDVTTPAVVPPMQSLLRPTRKDGRGLSVPDYRSTFPAKYGELFAKRGVRPSILSLAEAFGIAENTAKNYIRRIRESGGQWPPLVSSATD